MATIKKIICPNCEAKLKFDLDKLTSAVVKSKCPGCKTVIQLKKPASPVQDLPSSQTTAVPKPVEDVTGHGLESNPAENMQKPDLAAKGITENSQADSPKKIKPVALAEASEKIEEQILPAHKSLPEEEKAPLTSEEKHSITHKLEDSLLKDYLHDKLAEYEDGEAEAGDLEWTRYANKKEQVFPKTKIDLDLIPVEDADLHEALADLRQAEVYNLQGETNLGKNLIKQAIRDFNHALEIYPDYVDALVNRGSAYILQNNYNESLADLNHALDLEKKQAEIYNLRGEVYLLNKLHDEAIKDFTKAIILNPTYSDAYLNRARAYSEKGMSDEADSDYSQAVEAEPDKFSSFIDLDGAESLFEEEGLSTKEKEAEYIQQGLENLKRKKYHEAIESFTQAINLSTNNAISYICRGQAYVELGQPDEAVVDLNRAVIFDPLNPVLYYWRAMAWKALESSINMVEDLKVSCELGYAPACIEYETFKPQKH